MAALEIIRNKWSVLNPEFYILEKKKAKFTDLIPAE